MRQLLQRWRTWWDALHADNAAAIEQVPDRWVGPAIVLASALALYVEMVMVRWHATSAHVFAIFKNVSLLSCFLGLGIGFGLAARRRNVSLAAFVPLGMRDNSGIRFKHNFPADGEYRLSVLFPDQTVGLYTGSLENESTLVVMVDGKIMFKKSIGGMDDLMLNLR